MDLLPRSPNENEVSHVVQFLDAHLRPGQPWSIAAEYPLVFNEANRHNLQAIFENGKIIAHAAIKYHILKTPAGLFKVAAIGSVLTSPDYRNQGHSQNLMNHCVRLATEAGADIAILWTDLYDFYRKLDFELAGTEVSVVLEDNFTVPDLGLRVLQSSKVDPNSILGLYSKHTVGSVRTAEEIRKFLNIPNARVYTAWDSQNQLKAYAIEGKGADLKGYVHEWGGGVKELTYLFSQMRKAQDASLTVIMPKQSQNLARALEPYSSVLSNGYLGMIRPLVFSNIMTKVKRYALNLGITDFVFDRKVDGTFVFGRGQDVFETNDLKAFTQVVFGAPDSTQFQELLAPILPLPMWIWGWDSV